MILPTQIKSREALKYTIEAEIKSKHVSQYYHDRVRGTHARAQQTAPIRILVPQTNFTRSTVSVLASQANKEHGTRLFTSWVKTNGVDYWVIQEEKKDGRRQARARRAADGPAAP